MSHISIPESLTRRFATAFEAIDATAASAYDQQRPVLTLDVNQAVMSNQQHAHVLGHVDRSAIVSNHENHSQFLATMFRLKSVDTLLQTVAWVYASYLSRGLRAEYFTVALEAWRDAVLRHLPEAQAAPIARFYEIMGDSHEDFLALSQQCVMETQVLPRFRDVYEHYLAALLKPDMYAALQIARSSIHTPEDLANWWQEVIRPAMYEVGALWAQGTISVGQEHLATSITQRVMTAFYPLLLDIARPRGALVVIVSPGELHEIGPRMVSDLLEIHGWDVHFTGASTPVEGLPQLLQSLEAQALCISTTLSPHLSQASEVIRVVKDARASTNTRIVVGGQAYGADQSLWGKVGADDFAQSPQEAIALLA